VNVRISIKLQLCGRGEGFGRETSVLPKSEITKASRQACQQRRKIGGGHAKSQNRQQAADVAHDNNWLQQPEEVSEHADHRGGKCNAASNMNKLISSCSLTLRPNVSLR